MAALRSLTREPAPRPSDHPARPWYANRTLHRVTGHRRDVWDGERYRCDCGYTFPDPAIPKDLDLFGYRPRSYFDYIADEYADGRISLAEFERCVEWALREVTPQESPR